MFICAARPPGLATVQTESPGCCPVGHSSEMPKAVPASSAVPAVEVVGPVLRRQVQELRSCGPGVHLRDADAVHDYRVASRRLRSELARVHSLLEPGLCQDVARELGRAAAAMSGVRDAEVVRHRVHALLRDESGEGVETARVRLRRLPSEGC